MKSSGAYLTLAFVYIISCTQHTSKKEIAKLAPVKENTDSIRLAKFADLPTILSKKEVPVLCYHHIRDAKPGESETMKSYSVSPEFFAEQMKALKDSGYETILPDDLYNYLIHEGKLPANPVMLTFDDTDE